MGCAGCGLEGHGGFIGETSASFAKGSCFLILCLFSSLFGGYFANKDLSSEMARLEFASVRSQVLDALCGPVQIYLKPNHTRQELLDAIQEAASKNDGLEKIKAFRMLREKAQVGATEEAKAVEDTRDFASLASLRDQLLCAPLEELSIPTTETMLKLSQQDCRDMIDVIRWTVPFRFSQEPSIPLYAAFQYRLFVALSQLCGQVGLLDLMTATAAEAALVLNASAKKHFWDEIETNLNDLESVARLPIMVKRCVHTISLVQKTWTSHVDLPTLQGVQDSLTEFVCRRATKFIFDELSGQTDLISPSERTTLEGAVRDCNAALVPLDGAAASKGLQRRRMRLLEQLLSLASVGEVNKNIEVLLVAFDAEELHAFVRVWYGESIARKSLLKLLLK